ncbi:MAG: cytochrome c [Candidatus Thiodiazotropha sp. (ex. Lucinisca nassula)]|nr:cytochrome c [Candidatus Thiodiazotropha sp. (ex. Lucinisca nassula)]MBW9270814.1 cytochrome c [Candidatus Thiodiazotropha sp. (ex. Lucinisca nassula)]
MNRLLLPLILLLISPFASHAIDLENGKKQARSCALCHGHYGQGTPGPASPRLAGTPAGYMVKQIEAYINEDRINPRMVITSSLHSLSEDDIDDIAAYYESINLDKINPVLNHIPLWRGDVALGRELYEEGCKSCHRKNGMGKSRKGIPALALQYPRYLFRQIKMFQWDKRVHDDDPEDDTFDNLSDKEIEALLSYVSSLAPNNKK